MTGPELKAALARAAIVAAHADYIERVSRPCIHLLPSTTPASRGTSRIGGAPDLPEGMAWPEHGGGPHRFLLQLDLAQVGAPEGSLPRSGLVSFFAADDEDQTHFWQDPGYIEAYYWPDAGGLKTTDPPEPVRPATAGKALRFSVGVDVPRDRYQRTDWPIPELSPALCEWWAEHRPADDAQSYGHLLGYPAVSALAYDPTPGPSWSPLLSLRSDDDLEFWWHDGGPLHVFGEPDRTRTGDLSNLKADAG